jgi:hypothetical protein
VTWAPIGIVGRVLNPGWWLGDDVMLASVLRRRMLVPGMVALVAVVVAVTVFAVGRARPVLSRDQRWRGDIAYLASELPQVHVGGLLQVPRSAWNAAAARLELEVPRLTDGQVIVGMARMVAMLHDDETWVDMPQGSFFPFKLTWVGGKLYLVRVPVTDHDLLGAQILGVGGYPIEQVLSRIGSTIGYQDLGLLRDRETGYLTDFPPLLSWLGVTRSPECAALTVRTVGSVRLVTRLCAVTRLRAGALASIPQPLYLTGQDRPYWLRILPGQRAVYLRYNQCVDDSGFGQLAAQALAVLRRQPSYRLIVDFRDNGGGSTLPFASLLDGLRADPAFRRPGRVVGLVNQYTDSAATVDANSLGHVPGAVLIGQQPGDPIDEYGNEKSFTLPYSAITVTYTTAIVNDPRDWLAAPRVIISPTIQQVLAGVDPVLDTALSYGR